jgi:RasGEF domain/RasGEF N-terminal motif
MGTTGKGRVYGGTLDQLIACLFDSKLANRAAFTSVFLRTYPSFTTDHELLAKLMAVYEANCDRATGRRSVRFMLIAFLKLFITKHYFSLHNAILDTLVNFVEQQVCPADGHLLSDRLLRVLHKGSMELQRTFDASPPPPLLPKKMTNIVDVHPVEVARQITMHEYELFRRVGISELLNNRWSSEDRQSRAPNVCAIISRFNHMSDWIVSLILELHKLHKRVHTLEYTIRLLQELRKLQVQCCFSLQWVVGERERECVCV